MNDVSIGFMQAGCTLDFIKGAFIPRWYLAVAFEDFVLHALPCVLVQAVLVFLLNVLAAKQGAR